MTATAAIVRIRALVANAANARLSVTALTVAAIEATVADLLRSKRLKGVHTGAHPTTEVGDMVCAELRSRVEARV